MPQSLSIHLVAGVVYDEHIFYPCESKDKIELPDTTQKNIIEMSQRDIDDHFNNNCIHKMLSERPSLDTVDCVFHEGEFEEIRNIIGYRISSCGDELALGLGEIYPKYQTSAGYEFCPSIPIEKDITEEARIMKYNLLSESDISIGMVERVKHKMTLIQNGWNYKYYSRKMPYIAMTAQYILAQIDIDVQVSDIKLIMVWCWD
jgi:hypothetical protein